METKQENLLWNKIQKLRKEMKLTQDAFTRKADIPYTTLTKIEIGVIKEPSVYLIAKIAKVLNVTIESLIEA